MKKGVWIAIGIIILLAIGATITLNIFNKKGNNSIKKTSYAGSDYINSIESSTKSNAFKITKLNPFENQNE